MNLMNHLATAEHGRHAVVTFTDLHETLIQVGELPPDETGRPSGPEQAHDGDAAAPMAQGADGGAAGAKTDRAKVLYEARGQAVIATFVGARHAGCENNLRATKTNSTAGVEKQLAGA